MTMNFGLLFNVVHCASILVLGLLGNLVALQVLGEVINHTDLPLSDAFSLLQGQRLVGLGLPLDEHFRGRHARLALSLSLAVEDGLNERAAAVCHWLGQEAVLKHLTFSDEILESRMSRLCELIVRLPFVVGALLRLETKLDVCSISKDVSFLTSRLSPRPFNHVMRLNLLRTDATSFDLRAAEETLVQVKWHWYNVRFNLFLDLWLLTGLGFLCCIHLLRLHWILNAD